MSVCITDVDEEEENAGMPGGSGVAVAMNVGPFARALCLQPLNRALEQAPQDVVAAKLAAIFAITQRSNGQGQIHEFGSTRHGAMLR
jgi:hypothetical protein